MSGRENIIPITRGELSVNPVQYGDGAGGNADLTGYSVEIHQQEGFPPGTLSIAFTNAAEGQLAITIDDRDQELPLGAVARFWFRVFTPTASDAEGPIYVNVK